MKLPLAELPVWIINLNDNHERWNQCTASLETVFHRDLIKRVPAINGLDYISTGADPQSDGWNPELLKSLQREGLVNNGDDLDPIRVAICLSHQRALQAFLDSGRPWGIIFEDDARVGEVITQIAAEGAVLNPPDDAELLFLHHRVTGSSPYLPQNHGKADGHLYWQMVTGGLGLEAYAVSQKGASKMLEAMRPVVYECDLQLMTFMHGYADLPERAKIRRLMGRDTRLEIKAYCPSSPLFHEAEGIESVKMNLLREAGLFSSVPIHYQGKRQQATHETYLRYAAERADATYRSYAAYAGYMRYARYAASYQKGYLSTVLEPELKQPDIEFSFCVTCMGRGEFIKQTLAHNLEIIRTSPHCNLVLLNYNSTDGLHEYIMSHYKDALSKGLLKYHHTQIPTHFHHSKAKNLAHRLATGTFVVNLDADNTITAEYYQALRNAVTEGYSVIMFDKETSRPKGGIIGRICIEKKLFEEIRGYDEEMVGYGWEDYDLVERANNTGAKIKLISHTLATYVGHDDDIRTVNVITEGRSLKQSADHNLARFTELWEGKRKIANADKEWAVIPDDIFNLPAASDITLIVANWRRPDKIRQIFDSAPPGTKLFLLDNAHPGYEAFPEDIQRADWYMKSNNNNLFLRWVMASQATTTYFCVHDDDVIVKDWEPYMQWVRDHRNEGFAGILGVDVNWGEPDSIFTKCRHSEEGGLYDFICGRVTWGRTELMQKNVRLFGTHEHNNIAEDISVASGFSHLHYLPKRIPGNVVELGSPFASCTHFNHNPSRQAAAKNVLYSTARDRLFRHPEKTDRGVVMCVSPAYEGMAMMCVNSLKRSNPGLPVYMRRAKDGISSRETKLAVNEWSPFQTTLYLDCDTVVVGDLTPLFDLVRPDDVFMTPEKNFYTTLAAVTQDLRLRRENGEDYFNHLLTLPQDTPYMNSGVILFQKTPKTHEFFQHWLARWELRGKRTLDQLPLTEIGQEGFKVQPLPEWWNCQIADDNDYPLLPQAAVYHFLGGGVDAKLAQYDRWKRQRKAGQLIV